MTAQATELHNEGNIFHVNQDYKAVKIRFSSVIELLENSNVNKAQSEQECVPSIFPSQLFRALSHRSAARLSIAIKTADALTDGK